MTSLPDPNAHALRRRIAAIAPFVIVPCLFAAGLFALHKLLAQVDLREVMAQVRGTPTTTLLLAFASTLGAYAALIGYDWSALRYIRKTLPLRTIALGGFLGYAFGNTIGLNTVSGGAVRYRIYSALGLSAYDVAAIAAFASLAYGFGATLIGLLSLAIHPMALHGALPLDPTLVRWAAAGTLAALVLTLGIVSARRMTLRVWRFVIPAPSPAIMAGQIGFTILDITLAAATLYVLMPTGNLDFATFVAVFAAATMAGVLSHVPGGVGVFESVVIASLPADVPIQHAAAALLLFRIIYYLVPFAIALVLLALSELAAVAPTMSGPQAARIAGATRTLRPIVRAASAVAPSALAALTFAAGAWMLVSALIPSMSETAEELELLLPIAFVEGGALLSSIIGVILIIVAHGLARRIDGAFWIALAALLAGAATAILHGIDYDRAIVLVLAALVMWPCRREFHRTARLLQARLEAGWIALIFGVAASSAFLMFFAHKGAGHAHELWWQFAFDDTAPRAMRAGLVASLALTAVLVVVALRPRRLPPGLPSPADLADAARIIAGQRAPEANLALSGDKALIFSDARDGFVMYGVQGRSWIALGDPVGAPDAAARLAWAFADAAAYSGARPIFHEVSEAYLPLWIDMGLTLHKLGEEAVVDLTAFSLDGPARAGLRAAWDRAGRGGLTFELAKPPHAPELFAALSEISAQWLSGKNVREKRFSVGRFNPAYLGRFPIALARLNGAPVAFANVMGTALHDMASIDLMRHGANAPNGVMAFMFTALMLRLKDDGIRCFSLGVAPLSGLEARRGAALWTQFGAHIYRHGGHFYDFDSLRRFKQQFDPEWRPRYLACPTALPAVGPLTDVSKLIAGGAG